MSLSPLRDESCCYRLSRSHGIHATRWKERMTADTPAPVFLRKDLARSIRRGHPWIYRDALMQVEGLADGAVVQVHTKDGKPIARGFWDQRSPIAVRVLESGGPGHSFADTETLVAERLKA